MSLVAEDNNAEKWRATYKGALIWGGAIGALNAVIHMDKFPGYQTAGQISHIVGFTAGPALMFCAVLFISRAFRTHHNSTVVVRLGNVFCWILCGASLLVGLFMLFVMLFAQPDILSYFIMLCCAGVFILGRATRYVLSGY